MEITRDQLEKRLGSSKNLCNLPSPAEFTVTNSSENHRTNVPQLKDPVLRTIVGSLYSYGESASSVAKEMGVTKNQVISSANSKREEVRERIEENKEKVCEAALTRLMQTLNLLGPEDIAAESPKDRAAIAAQMSKIVRNTSSSDTGGEARARIVVYAPNLKKESHFNVIDV